MTEEKKSPRGEKRGRLTTKDLNDAIRKAPTLGKIQRMKERILLGENPKPKK